MSDVDRPMNGLGHLIHAGYRVIARGTVVPKTPEDERGAFSALFARLDPLRERTLRWKAEHRRVYRIAKILLNLTLLSALMAMIFAVLHVLEAITA